MRRVLILLMVLLALGSLAMAAVLRFRKTPSQVNHQLSANQIAAQPATRSPNPFDSAKEGEPGKFLFLTVRPTGFEPSQVTLQAAQYLVLVENRTGLNSFGVVVEREQGERLRQVQIEPLQRRWKQTIDLKPGRYFISEAAHPEWKCILTITSH
jgi:hypothetical protein